MAGDLALLPTAGRLPEDDSHLEMGTAREGAVRKVIIAEVWFQNSRIVHPVS